jgi:predicted nucleic acid-binding protein
VAADADWYWIILHGSTFVAPRLIPNVIAEDPDDNKLIAFATEGQVDYIVSEDKDLHRLGHYHSIRVIGKQGFLRILEAG